MSVIVFWYFILISTDVSIEKIYKKLKTVFDHISKHLALPEKYYAVCCIFNSHLSVQKCGETGSIPCMIYYSLLFNKLQHYPNMVMMLSISVIRR